MMATEAWSSADPLSSIQAADPNFDADHFLEFAEMAFFLVKKAVQERNPTGARALVGESVYEELVADAKDMTARGVWPVLDGLFVAWMSIEGVVRDGGFTFITVRFKANAANFFVDASARIVEGTNEQVNFEEAWTFARKDGVTSKIGGGVMEYKCPNCASPLSLTELGVCQHCGAPVASGQLEWVAVRMA